MGFFSEPIDSPDQWVSPPRRSTEIDLCQEYQDECSGCVHAIPVENSCEIAVIEQEPVVQATISQLVGALIDAARSTGPDALSQFLFQLLDQHQLDRAVHVIVSSIPFLTPAIGYSIFSQALQEGWQMLDCDARIRVGDYLADYDHPIWSAMLLFGWSAHSREDESIGEMAELIPSVRNRIVKRLFFPEIVSALVSRTFRAPIDGAPLSVEQYIDALLRSQTLLQGYLSGTAPLVLAEIALRAMECQNMPLIQAFVETEMVCILELVRHLQAHHREAAQNDI
jgi:hypothetical protein